MNDDLTHLQQLQPEEAAPSLYGVSVRLVRVETLIQTLVQATNQSQNVTAAFMQRMEAMEQRQTKLESNMATRDDLQKLCTDITSVRLNDAEQRGGTKIASWSVDKLLSIIAIIVSLVAVFGVGQNREKINTIQSTPSQSAQPFQP